MDHLQQQQSFSGSKTHAECTEPIIPYISGAETSFEELFDQHSADFHTNTHDMKQLVDSVEIEKALALPGEAIPTSLVVVPLAKNYGIQQLSESGNGVEQLTDNENVVADADQRNYTSINRQILFTEQTTVPNNALVPVKGTRRKRGKKTGFSIVMETVPNKADEYLSEISVRSTELSYHGKTIPVNVKQFYDTPIIGQGEFGIIHRVVIKEPYDIRMVVKRISRRKDENGLSSADTELKTMRQVGLKSSSYIVDYYGAVIDPDKGEVCIYMELMDASVADFYLAMHPLDKGAFKMLDPLVRRIIHNIASALHTLENERIVHRDVKPANILINKNGEVKLCDFGLCGNWTELKSDLSFAVGTIRYQPPYPEPCAIDGDMWALGISLLEIVSGKHPFADWTDEEIPFKILEWKPEVPTTISYDIQQLILHLLKKEAKERPQSYTEILSKPCIYNVPKTPSIEECDFIRRVIGKIRPTDNSNG